MKAVVVAVAIALFDTAQANGSCPTTHADKTSCDAESDCTWCECGALPSACWSKTDAAKLPAGVYKCDGLPAGDASGAVADSTPPPNYLMMFQRFKEEYGKLYSSTVEEEQRFLIFKDNVDFAHETNAANHSFRLGVTEWTDQTADEFGQTHFGFGIPDKQWGDLPNLGVHDYKGEPLADSVDWNAKGAVTPVKNQGQCGSCWSFSTTGSLEGAWEIATKKLVSISEQQFVDCDKVDSGCSGGLMDHAFKYAEANDLCTEESYPYKAVAGTCQATKCTVGIPKGDVVGFKDVTADSKEALMSAIEQQPVSIAIEADKRVFQLYKTGVLKSLCGSSLDHGVLAVGYGTESGTDYWLVKNSWGPTWGADGFVKLFRGKGGAGECGLLTAASYPVVKAGTESTVVV